MFEDAGERAGIYRFSVDLGSLPTSKPYSRTFHLSGLPRANFVPYLIVEDASIQNRVDHVYSDWESSACTIAVHCGGDLVVEQQAPLTDWIVCSGRMLYHLDLNFDASLEARYDLTISLDSSVTEFPTHKLVLLGGGWQDYATNHLHFPDDYP